MGREVPLAPAKLRDDQAGAQVPDLSVLTWDCHAVRKEERHPGRDRLDLAVLEGFVSSVLPI